MKVREVQFIKMEFESAVVEPQANGDMDSKCAWDKDNSLSKLCFP